MAFQQALCLARCGCCIRGRAQPQQPHRIWNSTSSHHLRRFFPDFTASTVVIGFAVSAASEPRASIRICGFLRTQDEGRIRIGPKNGAHLSIDCGFRPTSLRLFHVRPGARRSECDEIISEFLDAFVQQTLQLLSQADGFRLRVASDDITAQLSDSVVE